MRLLRTAQRSQENLANDFAELIEEGRALLGEMVGKPVKTATRDTIDEVSGKVADLQSYALAAAREGIARGAQYGKHAGRLVRENPWPTLAGGVALGVIAMLLWRRR
jgi:ElaB/YqjD/DUF883 family membrane-anchored ribosome-binding protein